MSKIGMIAGAVGVVAASTPVHAACRVLPFKFFPGTETHATMYVTAGQFCGVIIHAGGSSRFDSVRISATSKHGTVSPRAAGGATYRPLANFKGEDSFSFTVTGRMTSGTGTAAVTVAVLVQ
jgi:hypothetical protein